MPGIPQGLVFDPSLIFPWWFHLTVNYRCQVCGSLVFNSFCSTERSFRIVYERVCLELITLSPCYSPTSLLLLVSASFKSFMTIHPFHLVPLFIESMSPEFYWIASPFKIILAAASCSLFLQLCYFSLSSLVARLLLMEGLPVSRSSVVLKLEKSPLTL